MEVKISLTAGRFNKTATAKHRTGLAYAIMSLKIGKFFLFFYLFALSAFVFYSSIPLL